MSRFFNDENSIDTGAIQTQLDRAQRLHISEGCDTNGGISNEYYLNDYRNRMPFHYIEDSNDGYYYWQYGATMVIEFIFEDAVAITDDTPKFVTQVRKNGKNITNLGTMVADIVLGTMADEGIDNYYTRNEINTKILSLWNSLNAKTSSITNELIITKNELESARQQLVKINKDLYSIAGPEYLMNKLVQGTNIKISRDLTDPENPKLTLDSTPSNQQSLIVTEGRGTIQEPFLVTQPSEVKGSILDSMLLILFTGLEENGFVYNTADDYYLKATSSMEGEITTQFKVSGTGATSQNQGLLMNSLYILSDGVMIDSKNAGQSLYFGPNVSNYVVEDNKPFIFMRGEHTTLYINSKEYTQITYANTLKPGEIITLDIQSLPKYTPVTAILVNSGNEEAYLSLAMTRLPIEDLTDTIINQTIPSSNVEFEAVTIDDSDW